MDFIDTDCRNELEFKNNSIVRLKEELFLANKRIQLLSRKQNSKPRRSHSRVSRGIRSHSKGGKRRNSKRRNSKRRKR
jgi:hypothetical protein